MSEVDALMQVYGFCALIVALIVVVAFVVFKARKDK
jgi:hypothetical protein